MALDERLSKLERRFGVVASALSLVVAALIGLVGYQAYKIHQLSTATSLRLRELRIYDGKGVDRVVISGHLPEPTLNGKPIHAPPRAMAGMLIYDGSATERGGYGTADGYANALLTLDAKTDQEVLLLVEPGGGPFFILRNGKGSMATGVGDKPFLTLKAGKDVVFAKPEGNEWTTRAVK